LMEVDVEALSKIISATDFKKNIENARETNSE
jgi:hypothetical protein